MNSYVHVHTPYHMLVRGTGIFYVFATLDAHGLASPNGLGLVRPVLGQPPAPVCAAAPYQPGLVEPMFVTQWAAELTAQSPLTAQARSYLAGWLR